MQKIVYALAVAFLGAFALLAPAIADDTSKAFSEYQTKALYIYNFTKFVAWPGGQAGKAINVCFVGENAFGSALNLLKQAPNLTIKRNVGGGDIASCQLLFINKSENSNLSSLISQTQSMPILTVSDIEGFASEGGIIEMVKSENNIGAVKIKLIINLKLAQAKNLRIDAQLLEIASEVIR